MDAPVTRIEFAIKYTPDGRIGPITTDTAERFITQGETRGKLGILMRRESGPDHTGEWQPHDGGPAELGAVRIYIDADCPNCGWGERWADTYPDRRMILRYGCSKCSYRSQNRNA